MTDALAVGVRCLPTVEQLSTARMQARRGVGRNHLQRASRGVGHVDRLLVEVPRSRYSWWKVGGIMKDMSAGVDEVGR